MKLRTVLTIAAVLACLRPAVAMVVSDVPMMLADTPAAQTAVQVFVVDARAAEQPRDAAAGHGAGLRPPRSDDDPTAPLFDAAGNALYFTLEKWRAAAGEVDIGPDEGGTGDRINLNLHRLIAFGHYSVFLRTDAADGPHYTPLDGSGITNNFDAHEDGAANVTISAPDRLTSGTWIVAVYHSDAADHGNSPGDFAHTAHLQLVVKLP